MKNSIKRAQSQARLSFAERENFRPKVKQLKKTLLTLVALLAVTTGAWAEETLLLTIESKDYQSFIDGSMTFDDKVTVTFSDFVSNYGDNFGWYTSTGSLLTVAGTNGYTITSCKFYTNDGIAKTGYTVEGESPSVYLSSRKVYIDDSKSVSIGESGVTKIEVYTAAASSATAVDIAWDKATKTGTFGMPAGNVTVSVEYFPQAALTEAPTAINDVPATTDGAIVKAGTVANIGSTETAQGTVMYYVSQTALDDAALLALAADKWTADVPTAESLAEGEAYVYYYVRGNDSDTDEENFSDGDILSANALNVTIAAEPTYAVTFADGVNPEPPAEPEWTASPNTDVKKGQTVTVTYTGTRKVIGVKAEKKAAAPAYPMASEATAADYGKVVCAAGHLHDAKTAVPEGCTAVAVFAYIDGGNKRMGIALQDAENATWNMITTDGAYNNTLCAVPGTWNVAAPTDAEWFVGTKEIYEAIFTNLGSTTDHVSGKSYDDNVNAFITTGVGGTALSDDYWCTTSRSNSLGWKFSGLWGSYNKTSTNKVRPVLAW